MPKECVWPGCCQGGPASPGAESMEGLPRHSSRHHLSAPGTLRADKHLRRLLERFSTPWLASEDPSTSQSWRWLQGMWLSSLPALGLAKATVLCPHSVNSEITPKPGSAPDLALCRGTILALRAQEPQGSISPLMGKVCHHSTCPALERPFSSCVKPCFPHLQARL